MFFSLLGVRKSRGDCRVISMGGFYVFVDRGIGSLLWYSVVGRPGKGIRWENRRLEEIERSGGRKSGSRGKIHRSFRTCAGMICSAMRLLLVTRWSLLYSPGEARVRFHFSLSPTHHSSSQYCFRYFPSPGSPSFSLHFPPPSRP